MTVCPNQESIGYHYDGGFAEYMVVPAKVLAVDGLNRIPDGLSFAEASVAEPLACVLNGQELARVGAGDDVVVIGSGPIGCLHVRLARARGAARVFLVDLNREPARAGGAIGQARRRRSAPRETDAVDDGRSSSPTGAAPTSSSPPPPPARRRSRRVQMAARQGRISFFGGLPKDNPVISLDSNLVHYRELTIVGANGSSPAHNKKALALIADGSVPVADLITHRLPLADVLDAIEIVGRGEAIKVTVEP